LTTDGSILYMTDSGHELFHVAPHSYEIIKIMPIVDPKLGDKLIYGNRDV